MATHCNGNDLPFTLYFEDRNHFPYEVKEMWKQENQIQKEKLPVLKENAKIGLRFYTDTKEDYDSQAVCYIQTNRYNNLDEQETYAQRISATSDTVKWIYDTDQNNDFPWRMGVYLLEVNFKGERYVGGINVLPHHLDEQQVEHIHTYLNEQVEGIIYDFVYSNHAPSESDQIVPKHWYYEYVRKLSERFQDFMFAMTAITKKPREHIRSEYYPSLKPGRIDRKSIQWLQSNKGIAKNEGQPYHGYQLIKNKVNHYDTKENQWIKNILLLWKRDISEVYDCIKSDEIILQRQKTEKMNHLEEYQNKRENLFAKRDIGRNTKNDIKSRILMTEKDIRVFKKRQGILSEWLDLLHRMENKLVYFLNYSFFQDVTRGMKKPVLKNYRYYQIDHLYAELKNIRENDGEETQLTSVLKPTWQIYEYFCLFQVINYFQSSGYKLIEGLGEDILRKYFEDGIQSGTKFVLEKEEKVIHVWYDHYHAHTIQEAAERRELFHTYHPKKKPDIKVDSFEKKEDELWLRGSIILDAKFSKMSNIYNDRYINETTEQLTGYYSFFYHGNSINNLFKHAPCVSQVICLYAGDDSRNIKEEKQHITFIKLHPSYETEEVEITGQSELFHILENV